MTLMIDVGWFGVGFALTVTVVNMSLLYYAKSIEHSITKLAKGISQNCKFMMEKMKYGTETDHTQSQ
jgi:hypothetical protein